MSDNAPKPLQLPLESADLPAFDERVLDAICLEHNYSILQFAMTLVEFKWNAYQIEHVAARWTWPWLAAAIAWERQNRGKIVVADSYLAALISQRAEHPEGIKIPTQPPEPSQPKWN